MDESNFQHIESHDPEVKFRSILLKYSHFGPATNVCWLFVYKLEISLSGGERDLELPVCAWVVCFENRYIDIS